MKVGLFILYILFCSIKFLIGPIFGMESGFTMIQNILGMFIGGLAGVFGFYFTAHHFMKKARKKRLRRMQEYLSGNKGKLPKTFTRRNVLLVKLKKRLGLYGIVFIALPIISMPIEGIICAKFFKHSKRLFPLLILSVAIWSVLLTLFYNYLYPKIIALF